MKLTITFFSSSFFFLFLLFPFLFLQASLSSELRYILKLLLTFPILHWVHHFSFSKLLRSHHVFFSPQPSAHILLLHFANQLLLHHSLPDILNYQEQKLKFLYHTDPYLNETHPSFFYTLFSDFLHHPYFAF